MSQHNVELEREPEAVDELLRKVDVLKAKRPSVRVDVVHPGIAAAIVDPDQEKCDAANAALGEDYDSA